jgi:hypothetical protein
VREEGEVIQGSIPSSVNIPMSRFEKVMDLHPDDFRKTQGFPKPALDQKIIFYCRSGARSTTALQIAKDKGFKKFISSALCLLCMRLLILLRCFSSPPFLSFFFFFFFFCFCQLAKLQGLVGKLAHRAHASLNLSFPLFLASKKEMSLTC